MRRARRFDARACERKASRTTARADELAPVSSEPPHHVKSLDNVRRGGEWRKGKTFIALGAATSQLSGMGHKLTRAPQLGTLFVHLVGAGRAALAVYLET